MGDVNFNLPGGGDVNIAGDVVGRDKITVNYNFNLKEWGATPLRGHKLPQRNPAFVGRTATFNAIAEKLKAENALVIVHGAGGLGKTQLAIEFGHLLRNDFPGGVFYLRAAQPSLMLGEIAACGDDGRLNVPGWENLPQPDQANLVQAEWQTPVPRLLIFDNCEDAQVLKEWRPTTGGTRVLVTARNANWPRTLTPHTLALPPLDRPDSLKLLGHADEAANTIAADLGDLPLALHLAGAYIAHYAQPPAQYLAELRAQAVLAHESLNDWLEEELPTEHTPNVRATFELSYGKLVRGDGLGIGELALKVFSLLAYCAPATPLPRDVLLRALNESEEDSAGAAVTEKQLIDALHALAEVGLTMLDAEKNPSQHRLLQAFAEEKAADAGRQTAEKFETALLQLARKLNKLEIPAPMRPLVPHLETVAARAEATSSENAGSLFVNLGYHFNMIASYPAARIAFECALGIFETQLGAEHSQIALTVNNLGMVYKALGDLPAARAAYERALKILETQLGTEHPNVASAINNLGMVYQALGDLPAARAALERALKIDEGHFGPDHPNVARDVNNLGSVYQDLGDLPAARAAYERALKIDEQHFGPDHPSVAIRVSNLGLVYQDLGDLPAARAAYERALKIDEQHFGSDHPTVARDVNNLGSVYQALGDLPAARAALERALKIDEQHFGPDHPSVAGDVNNLGMVYYALGDLPAARAAFERALKIMEKYAPNNPNTKLLRENLAQVIEEMESQNG